MLSNVLALSQCSYCQCCRSSGTRILPELWCKNVAEALVQECCQRSGARMLPELWYKNVAGALVQVCCRSSGARMLAERWYKNVAGALVQECCRSSGTRMLPELWYKNVARALVQECCRSSGTRMLVLPIGNKIYLTTANLFQHFPNRIIFYHHSTAYAATSDQYKTAQRALPALSSVSSRHRRYDDRSTTFGMDRGRLGWCVVTRIWRLRYSKKNFIGSSERLERHKQESTRYGI